MRRSSSAPMTSHPCPVPECGKPTNRDGHCRRRGCPNRFPDPTEARDAALAEMRAMLHNRKATR